MKHYQLRSIAPECFSASTEARFLESRVHVRSCATSAFATTLLALLIGCGTPKTSVATVSADSAPPQATLFTVPADQLARLKVVPVETTTWMITVRTTGTVEDR